MINSIFENLFKPAGKKELTVRRADLTAAIDKVMARIAEKGDPIKISFIVRDIQHEISGYDYEVVSRAIRQWLKDHHWQIN